MGEQVAAAESQVALADLSLEEGHAANAERPLREALEIFRQQKLSDDELAAHLVLARALLSQAKEADAQREVAFAGEIAAKSQNRGA
jgi:Tfp pilus assembly protein PilF